MRACIPALMQIDTSTHIFIHIHTCTYKHTYTHVYTRIHTYTDVLTRTYKYTHVLTSIHTYPHVYTRMDKYTVPEPHQGLIRTHIHILSPLTYMNIRACIHTLMQIHLPTCTHTPRSHANIHLPLHLPTCAYMYLPDVSRHTRSPRPDSNPRLRLRSDSTCSWDFAANT